MDLYFGRAGTPLCGACGDHGLTCDPRKEFCLSVIGGVPDPAGNAIVANSCGLLGPCADEEASCTCVEKNLGFAPEAFPAGCVDGNDSLLHVTVAAP